jgi:DegV family protein with EDD domain
MHDEIHVVVDSIAAADETPLKDDARCHVLRLIVRHGDLEWQDGERSLAQMFAMVEETGKLPGTSQPPIGAMLELFSDLSRAGKKVIMLTVDSVLSGTYQTACVAARQVMDEIKGADIRVIDSKTAACPISGIAMELLARTAEGMDIDEAEKLGLDMVARTDTFFSVNTLDYLQKGGRIGAVGALIGNIFGIRPIVHLDKDGKLEVVDKCRTRKKVLKRMVELAAEKAPLEAIYVANAEAQQDAEEMKAQMQVLFPEVPVMLTSIGTVLAAHLGPGVIGLFVRHRA